MLPCYLHDLQPDIVALQTDIYQDGDDSRKDDIASLKVDQGDFKVFYDKVRDLKEFYRNRPIEVTEVSSASPCFHCVQTQQKLLAAHCKQVTIHAELCSC